MTASEYGKTTEGYDKCKCPIQIDIGIFTFYITADKMDNNRWYFFLVEDDSPFGNMICPLKLQSTTLASLKTKLLKELKYISNDLNISLK